MKNKIVGGLFLVITSLSFLAYWTIPQDDTLSTVLFWIGVIGAYLGYKNKLNFLVPHKIKKIKAIGIVLWSVVAFIVVFFFTKTLTLNSLAPLIIVVPVILFGGMFIGIPVIIESKRKSQEDKSYDNSSNQERPNKEESFDNDMDIRKMYRKLMHKYHPDFARSDDDKKFRTDLTAKLNRAYQEGDIATLRLFL